MEIYSSCARFPIRDILGDLYLKLGETDTWFGLWRLRAKQPNTGRALAYEQQGELGTHGELDANEWPRLQRENLTLHMRCTL